MLGLQIKDVIHACSGKLVGKEYTGKLTGVSTDSRTLRKGEIFVALRGEKFDGHNFVKEAIEKGAVALIVQERSIKRLPVEKNREVSWVLVKDTLLALQKLATYYRHKFTVKVIGVTGSSGKTTTKEILAHILSKKFSILKTPESYNNEIGIPLTLFKLKPNHQIAILEMAMRKVGDINLLCNISSPEIGVITNIGTAHIGLLKSKNKIARAKGELIRALPENGLAVLNADDTLCRQLAKRTKAPVIFYGIEKKTNILAKNIKMVGVKGWRFDLILGRDKKVASCYLPLLGYHNIYNLLAASAVAENLGMDLFTLREAIRELTPMKGRLQLIRNKKGVRIINDTYNANPDSLAQALEVLVKQIKGGRKIAVLGDMKELGERKVREHKKMGKKISKMNLDYLFTLGDLAKLIAEEAKNKSLKVFTFDKREELVLKLQDILLPKDVILVKGSRAMQMEKIVEEILK